MKLNIFKPALSVAVQTFPQKDFKNLVISLGSLQTSILGNSYAIFIEIVISLYVSILNWNLLENVAPMLRLIIELDSEITQEG